MTKCCKKIDYPIVTISEKGSSAIKLLNPDGETWRVCDVDGCLINDDSKRCDRLVGDDETFTLLIELKGRDIEKACEQLTATFQSEIIRPELKGKLGAIVVSRVVKIPAFDSFSAKMKQSFASRFRARFVVERTGRTVCPKKCCGL